MRALFFLLLFTQFKCVANHTDSITKKWEVDLIEKKLESKSLLFVSSPELYNNGWDSLAHPIFWRKIMVLSPDSCIINIGKTREIITQLSINDWDKYTDEEKDFYRDSIREIKGLAAEDKVYMTSGKKNFYKFNKVFHSLSRGVEVFDSLNVDPWYAQAILLIESPGQLAKSNVGAYGAFQLMKGVARSHGLRVDKYVDERKDFVKSAYGASHLLSTTCIPQAKRILNAQNIDYNETDLWFRLFVLHIYHAGAGNVEAVVKKINPKQGGRQLIEKMWITSAGNFKNSSQNYSQLALASLLILDEMIVNH
ncbi:MAG: transglycosylase SLT domain-containing protein [Lishizhenia sp.]